MKRFIKNATLRSEDRWVIYIRKRSSGENEKESKTRTTFD